MSYRIVVTKRAAKDMSKLSAPVQKRIKKKLAQILSLPDPLAGSKTLTNSRYGDYRWRIGDYRVIFDVDGKVIVLLQIQHRKDVYRP